MFQNRPDTTYLLTSVMLIEDRQYARIESGALFVIFVTDSGKVSKAGRFEGKGDAAAERGRKPPFSIS